MDDKMPSGENGKTRWGETGGGGACLFMSVRGWLGWDGIWGRTAEAVNI